VRVASPVVTAAPVLAALAQVQSERRIDLGGVVDQPQIGGVIYQWGENGNRSWKLPLLVHERSPSRTMSCFWAASTCRAPARSTPRTCWKSRIDPGGSPVEIR
jgi:hypothetical protein